MPDPMPTGLTSDTKFSAERRSFDRKVHPDNEAFT
jgi:hypothetical protein